MKNAVFQADIKDRNETDIVYFGSTEKTFNEKFNEMFNYFWNKMLWKRPCGVVANVLGCDTVVSKFESQSRCYVNFQANGKGMNFINPLPSYGWDRAITVLL